MRFIKKMKLIKLLNNYKKDGELVSKFMNVRFNDLRDYSVSGKLSVNELRDIYLRRYKHLLEIDKDVKGLSILINSLQDKDWKSTLIHSFKFKRIQCAVFSDNNINKIFGILEFTI